MKTLLTVTLIALIQNFSSGQDTVRVRFKIMTIPTQYLLRDFPLIFEKVFQRTALGLTVSYRPGTQNSGKIQGGTGLAGYYLDQNFQNDIYNGITVGLNGKYFLSNRKNLFVEGDLFYRYWWFDNTDCHFDNVEGYRFNAIRTEKQNVFGLKFLFGNSFHFKIKSRIKPIVELYLGAGLRYKTYTFETFNGTINDIYYTYKKETGNNLSIHNGIALGFPLSVQAGVRVGIGR